MPSKNRYRLTGGITKPTKAPRRSYANLANIAPQPEISESNRANYIPKIFDSQGLQINASETPIITTLVFVGKRKCKKCFDEYKTCELPLTASAVLSSWVHCKNCEDGECQFKPIQNTTTWLRMPTSTLPQILLQQINNAMHWVVLRPCERCSSLKRHCLAPKYASGWKEGPKSCSGCASDTHATDCSFVGYSPPLRISPLQQTLVEWKPTDEPNHFHLVKYARNKSKTRNDGQNDGHLNYTMADDDHGGDQSVERAQQPNLFFPSAPSAPSFFSALPEANSSIHDHLMSAGVPISKPPGYETKDLIINHQRRTWVKNTSPKRQYKHLHDQTGGSNLHGHTGDSFDGLNGHISGLDVSATVPRSHGDFDNNLYPPAHTASHHAPTADMFDSSWVHSNQTMPGPGGAYGWAPGQSYHSQHMNPADLGGSPYDSHTSDQNVHHFHQMNPADLGGSPYDSHTSHQNVHHFHQMNPWFNNDQTGATHCHSYLPQQVEAGLHPTSLHQPQPPPGYVYPSQLVHPFNAGHPPNITPFGEHAPNDNDYHHGYLPQQVEAGLHHSTSLHQPQPPPGYVYPSQLVHSLNADHPPPLSGQPSGSIHPHYSLSKTSTNASRRVLNVNTRQEGLGYRQHAVSAARSGHDRLRA